MYLKRLIYLRLMDRLIFDTEEVILFLLFLPQTTPSKQDHFLPFCFFIPFLFSEIMQNSCLQRPKDIF